MAETTVRGRVGEVEISLSTGKLAQLSDGAVTARIGDTEVLVTATASSRLRDGVVLASCTPSFLVAWNSQWTEPGQ